MLRHDTTSKKSKSEKIKVKNFKIISSDISSLLELSPFNIYQGAWLGGIISCPKNSRPFEKYDHKKSRPRLNWSPYQKFVKKSHLIKVMIPNLIRPTSFPDRDGSLFQSCHFLMAQQAIISSKYLTIIGQVSRTNFILSTSIKRKLIQINSRSCYKKEL